MRASVLRNAEQVVTKREEGTMFHVGIATDKRMLAHKSEHEHVERPERLVSIWKTLKTLGPFVKVHAREASDAELRTCHDVVAIQAEIRRIAGNPVGMGDMYAVPEKTELAARLAAGCSIQLVQDIVAGRIESGFAIVRPPSHHAHCDHASGFCFFNSALVAAVEASKIRKVLIVDIDVHHGDGIASILKGEKQRHNKNIAYVSIHRYDDGHFYPGTGHPGTYCDGRILNIGFNGGKGDDYYDDAMELEVVPFARSFDPKLIIVCAGFDAAAGDPIGGCFVTPRGYASIMRHIQSITRNIAMILEGGYNLQAIGECARACVQVLLTRSNEEKEEEEEEEKEEGKNDDSMQSVTYSLNKLDV